jgi:hypothetical protein
MGSVGRHSRARASAPIRSSSLFWRLFADSRFRRLSPAVQALLSPYTIFEYELRGFHSGRTELPREPLSPRDRESVPSGAHRAGARDPEGRVRGSEPRLEQAPRSAEPERGQARSPRGVDGELAPEATRFRRQALGFRRAALRRARLLHPVLPLRRGLRTRDGRARRSFLRAVLPRGSEATVALRGLRANRVGAPTLVRVPVPGPPRLAPYLRVHRGNFLPRGATPSRDLAIHLHPRPAALSSRSLRQDGRRLDARDRTLGHGKGAGGEGHRILPLHPVPAEDGAVRPRRRRSFLSHEPLGARADAHRIRALRPPPRCFHRRPRGPQGILRDLSPARHRVLDEIGSDPRSR